MELGNISFDLSFVIVNLADSGWLNSFILLSWETNSFIFCVFKLLLVTIWLVRILYFFSSFIFVFGAFTFGVEGLVYAFIFCPPNWFDSLANIWFISSCVKILLLFEFLYNACLWLSSGEFFLNFPIFPNIQFFYLFY